MSSAITSTSPLDPDGGPPAPIERGWRYVDVPAASGRRVRQRVPLTRYDVLHPQEGDVILQNANHVRNVIYLDWALRRATADRPGIDLLVDHRTDWQTADVEPHGPDIVVVENYPADWDGARGTFPMRDVDARPLLVVEVTSPSTRDVDLDEKVVEYHSVGVPFYVIADGRERAGEPPLTVLGFRWTPDGFERLPTKADGSVWIESVNAWFAPDGVRVVCLDRNRIRIPDPHELERQLQDALHRAERASAELRIRAEQAEAARAIEATRAAAARAEAAAEKQRADALAEELAALRAKLHSGPSSTNGH